jgi:hypothetical protein
MKNMLGSSDVTRTKRKETKGNENKTNNTNKTTEESKKEHEYSRFDGAVRLNGLNRSVKAETLCVQLWRP